MTSLIAWIPADTSGMLTLALEIAAKAALLCLVAWLAHLSVGRKRILLRSAIWHVCLLGLVVLPLAVVAFPRMPVAVWAAEMDQGPLPESAQAPETFAYNVGLDADLDGTGPSDREVLGALEAQDPPLVARSAQVGPGRIAGAAIVAVYLLAVIVLLIRLIGSLGAVARLRRASVALENPAWHAALQRWQRELGLRVPVQLRESGMVGVPIVVGWRMPAILVPDDMAPSADQQAIDAVLVHELTHVGRGDYAWNLLSRVVQAVYWPHPLVWLPSHMVRHVREEVCDAVCVYCLGNAREYCAVLVDVASGLDQRSSLALGMAMAHSSRLGRRLARVVECNATGRYLLSRRARAALVSAVVVATGILGALSAVHRMAAANDGDPRRDLADADRDGGFGRTTIRAGSEREPRAAKPGNATDAVRESGEPKAGSRPPRVRTAKVQRARFHEFARQPATLEAFEPASVRSRVTGIVAKVSVDEGDVVRKGDVLATIEVPDIEAALAKDEADLAQAEASVEQAQASLEAAEAMVQAGKATVIAAEATAQKAAANAKYRQTQLDRVKELVAKNAIDERTVEGKEEELAAAQGSKDAAEAEIQTARANLVHSKAGVQVANAVLRAALLRVKTAEVNLKRGKALESFREIRAPIDGVILSKHVETDAFVRPDRDQPLFTIARANVITVNVDVPERDAVRVQRGALASIELDALDGKRIPGKVSRIGYSVDPSDRTVAVRITISNPDGVLKPGMFGRAAIATGEKADRLSIPADAYDRGTKQKGDAIANTCLRVANGRVVPADVVLGEYDPIAGRVEVVDGLEEGDEVLSPLTSELLQRLHEGDRVEVVPASEKDSR